MCNLSEAVWKKGYAEGYKEGYAEGYAEGLAESRAEGKLNTSLLYYRRGRITLEEAAADAEMTPAEFLEKAECSSIN